MVAYYKHNIADWRGGTASLSDRAYRVYHVIVEQIMLYEGPIPAHERTLAGLSNRSTRDVRAAIAELVEAGKIAIEGGKISNVRAVSELVRINFNRENSAKGGRMVRERSANGRRMVGDVSTKPNDINGPPEAPLLRHRGPLDETRQEKTREERILTPQTYSVAMKEGGGETRVPARPPAREALALAPARTARAKHAFPPLPFGFAEFWEIYPNKVARPAAEAAFARALKEPAVTLDAVLAGAARYRDKADDRFWCSPANWLDERRWEDQPAECTNGHGLPFDTEALAKRLDEIRERDRLHAQRYEN